MKEGAARPGGAAQGLAAGKPGFSSQEDGRGAGLEVRRWALGRGGEVGRAWRDRVVGGDRPPVLGGQGLPEMGQGEADLAGLVGSLLAIVAGGLVRAGRAVVRERVQVRELGRGHQGQRQPQDSP